VTRPSYLAALRREQPALVRALVTPEGIPLRFTLGRAGDRAVAFVLDVVLQLVVLLALGLGLAYAVPRDTGSWLTAAIVLMAFFLFNFYFAFFEVRWQGLTPGKRFVGIRVIDARGGQLETSAVLARNLVRELEVWTPLRFLLAGRLLWPEAPVWAPLAAGAWAFVFLFMPLFNKDRLRVGDLIAGTRVVVQPKVVRMPDLVDLHAAVAGDASPVAAPVSAATYTFSDTQLGFYGIYELQVLEGVLRGDASTAAHQAAVRTVSDKVRHKIGYDVASVDDERFLHDFYAAQRAYLEQKLLFGQRREDKFSR
jgi:uncharacterized RDD family membrane protein YckC